uniref:Secreted protein n=1 Tax=Trichogramma kaykai TaxID=54128 RepID=A0ABD2XGL0_9HYME
MSQGTGCTAIYSLFLCVRNAFLRRGDRHQVYISVSVSRTASGTDLGRQMYHADCIIRCKVVSLCLQDRCTVKVCGHTLEGKCQGSTE